ncbi:DUF167 domain-containing protein [Rhizorhapis sp. SPR117]|uniref:DUF167 domain-containing protein n=1 Tax=Rhizorhapis sp. SPR117 TaxID=2912611 RepID=UPI001F35936A|nr:DUF167 family protein [Rhizorhapis sp. SPR117]
MAAPWRLDGSDVRLSVRLTPRSAKEAVGGMWQDPQGTAWLCASVRAVPEKGRANAALIKLLAKALEVPPSAISLEAGDSSRLKRVRISANAAIVMQRLQIIAGDT